VEKKPCPVHDPHKGISRRGFLGTVGGGVVGAVIAGAVPANAETPVQAAEITSISLRVNGSQQQFKVEPNTVLLDLLRDKMKLTGTKSGCERGECGACTVLIDGVPRYACQTLAIEVDGREITTIEGLADGEKLSPVQQAFIDEDALQCGFCTPGQIMAAEGLLRRNPNPSVEEIREGMSGNLCRCAAYQHIFKAVQNAAELKKKGGA
jgi:xanthine dehydrogenase YagT iron-sulfur-binding subunit